MLLSFDVFLTIYTSLVARLLLFLSYSKFNNCKLLPCMHIPTFIARGKHLASFSLILISTELALYCLRKKFRNVFQPFLSYSSPRKSKSHFRNSSCICPGLALCMLLAFWIFPSAIQLLHFLWKRLLNPLYQRLS